MTLAQRRELIGKQAGLIKALVKQINQITASLDLDDERMARRIDSAMKSEYGAINGLINLVASLAHWPADVGNGMDVPTNRTTLANAGFDLVLLEQIRQSRGYHTFISDELKIIDGVEPDYETYSQLCTIYLESILNAEDDTLTNITTIDPVKWAKREQIEIATAKLELSLKEQELELHKQLIASKLS